MGLFEVEVTVSNPSAPIRSATVDLLVDTGATLPWLPRAILESIGISPLAPRGYLLSDGRRVERETGIVRMTLDGLAIGATVVFAEPGEGSILGASALEAFGITVDPVGKKLQPRDL